MKKNTCNNAFIITYGHNEGHMKSKLYSHQNEWVSIIWMFLNLYKSNKPAKGYDTDIIESFGVKLFLYPPNYEVVGGYIGFTPSVRPSDPYLTQMITNMRGCFAYNALWPWPISSRSFGLGLENRVHSVASTVLDGFFPYLVQMITSMRRYVACDDLWPWPISSQSFDLDFENSVRSVTLSVLDRLFPYLPQIITTTRGCVAC